MGGHYLEEELYSLVRSDPGIFDFLQAGSLDGLWYWDLEHPDHEWMSPRFWQLFGYQPEDKQHLASEWQDMIDPVDRELALGNFRKHCADPNHPYDQVVRYRHHDGSTVWVRCRGLAIRDQQGKPTRMLGAHTDLTAMKRAEQELQRALDTVQQFNHMASHDLREPIRLVAAYSDLLETHLADGADAETRRYLGFIGSSARRLQQMIAGLAEYANVGQVGKASRPVPLGDLVQLALDSLALLVEEHKARVTVQEGLPDVACDPEQVARLIQNLIANAIKFRRQCTPEVRIAADSSLEAVTVCVADNGIGIEEAHSDQVFQMFRRLNGREEYDGTGVGLAICKRIVEGHGGAIWLDSVPGVGSKFYFSLPQIRGAEERAEKPLA
ncbi:MAG: ATP-binding protein [Myxococcales bacterium]|nr:ATP-binding protein [Myxococcales bacterium]